VQFFTRQCIKYLISLIQSIIVIFFMSTDFTDVALNAKENVQSESQDGILFSDVKYVCKSASLITESLQKGFDVAQLPNGDIIVTEVKTVNVHYKWDNEKNRMVKVSNQSPIS
jgi:hypothetical protein